MATHYPTTHVYVCGVNRRAQTSSARRALTLLRWTVLALPAAFSRGIFVQLFQPKRFSEPPASGFVVASESMRDALATANAELEVISTAESEGVLEGWKDIELGLVLNHGASLLIARGSPNVDLPARRAACLRLVWTRAADLQLIGARQH
jgi:hypothetical protein